MTEATLGKDDTTIFQKTQGVFEDVRLALRSAFAPPGMTIREYLMSRVILTFVPAVLMLIFAVVCSCDHYVCGKPSITPRELGGLWGVLFAPLVHVSWHSFGVDFWGWITLSFGLASYGPKLFVFAIAFLSLTSGVLTWLVGNSNVNNAGTAGILFGIFAFNMSLLPFKRPIAWTDVASFIIFDVGFGGLWWTSHYTASGEHGQSAGGYSSCLAFSGLFMGVVLGWLYFRFLRESMDSLSENMPLMHKGLQATDDAVGTAVNRGVSGLEKGLGEAASAVQAQVSGKI